MTIEEKCRALFEAARSIAEPAVAQGRGFTSEEWRAITALENGQHLLGRTPADSRGSAPLSMDERVAVCHRAAVILVDLDRLPSGEGTAGTFAVVEAIKHHQTNLIEARREGREDIMDYETRNSESQGRKVPAFDIEDGVPDFAEGSIRAAGSPSAWIDPRNGEPIQTYAHGQPMHQARAGERGLGEWLRTALVGPKNQAEARGLKESTDSLGGHLVPEPLSGQVIDLLRAESVVSKLGATVFPMTSETLKVAKVATDPTMIWHVEGAADLAVTGPTFSALTFNAHLLGGLVTISKELLADSPNAAAVLEQVVSKALAVQFDAAALVGAGSITGLAATSGIASASKGTNGGAITDWDDFLDLRGSVIEANASEPTGFVFAPRTAKTVSKFKDSTGQPLQLPPALAAVKMLHTTAISIDQTQGTSSNASMVLGGDWSDLLIGMRTKANIQILRERYAESHEAGFVIHLRADVQVARPASFGKVIGITP